MVWMRSSSTPQMKCVELSWTSPASRWDMAAILPKWKTIKGRLKPKLPTSLQQSGRPFVDELGPVFWQLRYMNTEEFPPRELMEYFKPPDVKKTLRTLGPLGMGPWNKGCGEWRTFFSLNVKDHHWISRSLKMIPWFSLIFVVYACICTVSICISNLFSLEPTSNLNPIYIQSNLIPI